MGLGTVLKVFPDAKIIMTHRDPVATVPSYCSMEASLYKLGSTDIGHEQIGTFWMGRLKEWLDNFMAVRAEADDSRFMDIHYKDQITNPVENGKRVLEFAGIPMSADIESGMDEWIEANRREHRAPHLYAMEDFGLAAAEIEAKFADYRAKFL